jgi:hypothetical protein
MYGGPGVRPLTNEHYLYDEDNPDSGPPSWARPFERSVDDEFGQAEFEELQKQYGSVLQMVHEAIQAYVDDSALTFESEDVGFPSRNRMTGEYYIGVESYWVNDEPWFAAVGRSREYRFSLMAHCLEHPFMPDQEDRDYLGLEVHFIWIPAEMRFEFLGVDSSSI